MHLEILKSQSQHVLKGGERMIKSCIFDLDGVIVDTAKYHFLAWQRLAQSLGFDFTHAENEKLKGVSRIESLKLILQMADMTLSEDRFESAWCKKTPGILSTLQPSVLKKFCLVSRHFCRR